VLELKNQVRTYFYQIQYLQHNQKQLLHLDSLYNDFIKVAELRYKTGDTKKVEISTAQAKQGEINLLLKQNGVYLQNAYQNLQALMNTQEPFEVSTDTEFQPLQVSTLLDSSVIANHPIIKNLHQEILIAEKTKKVEKAQGLPDFTIGYANQSLIGFQTINGQEKYFNSGNRFSYVNIGVAIPLTFGVTKARIKSLDYQKQAVEANAKQQQILLETQLQNAIQQYQQDLAAFNYYQQQALPNANDIVSSAQLGYRTGDISYVEYLFALQTATDIQLNYLKSIQQVNQSVINIYSIINQ
jgi:cobalt-zinc-cadmium resistance protein CzcA